MAAEAADATGDVDGDLEMLAARVARDVVLRIVGSGMMVGDSSISSG